MTRLAARRFAQQRARRGEHFVDTGRRAGRAQVARMRPGTFDAVARRLGDAEERDRRRAQRGGEVRESGVDAHDERRARHERGGIG